MNHNADVVFSASEVLENLVRARSSMEMRYACIDPIGVMD